MKKRQAKNAILRFVEVLLIGALQFSVCTSNVYAEPENPTFSDTVTLAGIPADYFDTSVSSLNNGTVFIDGIKCVSSIVSDGTVSATIPESLVGTAKTAVVFKYKSNNVAKWMKVWRLDWNSEDGSLSATEIPAFEDLIEYRGFSLRVADEEKGIKPGIRARTGVKVTVRDALTSDAGLTSGEGDNAHTYHLYEYGQLYINPTPWNSGEYNLICSETPTVSLVKCYYHDEDGTLHDIYKIEADTLTGENRYYFANVLPMENLTVSKIDNDRTFRAFVTVKDETGKEFTIYGPINTKSMFDVADGLLKSPTEANVGAVGSKMRTYVNTTFLSSAADKWYFVGIGDSIMQGCDGAKSGGESGYGTNMEIVAKPIPQGTAEQFASLLNGSTLYGALIKNDYFNGGATYSFPGSNSGWYQTADAEWKQEFTITLPDGQSATLYNDYDKKVYVPNDVYSIAKNKLISTIDSQGVSREKVKYIMVMAGHNDWTHTNQGQRPDGSGAVLGNIIDTEAPVRPADGSSAENYRYPTSRIDNTIYGSSETFSRGVYNTIYYLNSLCGEGKEFPNATVLVISPLQCVKRSGNISYNGSTYPNSSSGATLNDYVGRIEAFAKYGGFEHVKYIDLYHGWTDKNGNRCGVYGDSNFFSLIPDGVHPNQQGYDSISYAIANWMYNDNLR